MEEFSLGCQSLRSIQELIKEGRALAAHFIVIWEVWTAKFANNLLPLDEHQHHFPTMRRFAVQSKDLTEYQ